MPHVCTVLCIHPAYRASYWAHQWHGSHNLDNLCVFWQGTGVTMSLWDGCISAGCGIEHWFQIRALGTKLLPCSVCLLSFVRAESPPITRGRAQVGWKQRHVRSNGQRSGVVIPSDLWFNSPVVQHFCTSKKIRHSQAKHSMVTSKRSWFTDTIALSRL